MKLHRTVEDAVDAIDSVEDAVMACAAYPALHEIVFRNLDSLAIVDAFVMPTHAMVLAARPVVARRRISTCAAHPAPRALVPESARWIESSSNSQAADDCAREFADACITTEAAAARFGLTTIKDFGAVAMAFTVHAALPKRN